MSERIVTDPSQHGWIEVDGKWVWDASGGGAGAGMVISETEPTDKVEGMQWLNPTTGLVLFWDAEKWLQMPGGKDGKDGADGQDGADGGIEEAPNDGLQYVRQSEGWSEVKDVLWTENDDNISADGDIRLNGNLEINSTGLAENNNVIMFQRAGYWWKAMHDQAGSSFVLESQTGGVRMRMSYGGDVQFAGSVRGSEGPLISTANIIETLSTLRNATKDETTLEGLRDSIGNAVGGLIEKFEAMQSETSDE